MAAYLTLHCARPVSHLTAKDVLVGTDYGIFRDLAERWRITDADVESVLDHLRISTDSSVVPVVKRFLIAWGADDSSVVSVVIHYNPEDVAQERDFAFGNLPASSDPRVELVRERLSRTVECVSIRLGGEPLGASQALGRAIGWFLARAGDAMLEDELGKWFQFRGAERVLLLCSP